LIADQVNDIGAVSLKLDLENLAALVGREKVSQQNLAGMLVAASD